MQLELLKYQRECKASKAEWSVALIVTLGDHVGACEFSIAKNATSVWWSDSEENGEVNIQPTLHEYTP